MAWDWGGFCNHGPSPGDLHRWGPGIPATIGGGLNPRRLLQQVQDVGFPEPRRSVMISRFSPLSSQNRENSIAIAIELYSSPNFSPLHVP